MAAVICEPKRVGSGAIRLDRKLLLVLFCVVVGVCATFAVALNRVDFGVFYYAAHMVTDGSRHLLFEVRAQQGFQARFHRPPDLLFCHPPFVLIPLLPLTRLSIGLAFIPWTLASLALFVWSIKTLADHANLRFGNWPILFSLAFMPVGSCLSNGQLSIVLLSAFVWAYSLWRKEQRFLGGLALSLAAVKPQVLLGFVVILLLKRKWTELSGITTGCIVLVIASALVTGIAGLMRYPAFLLHGNGDYGSKVWQLVGWRGLLYVFGADWPILIAALSVGTLVLAAYLWRDLDTGFIAGTVAAMLVAYHLTISDVTLFLIPAFLSIKARLMIERLLLPLAVSALIVPEIFSAATANYAFLTIPLALCLVALAWKFYVTTHSCNCVMVAPALESQK